MTQDKPTPPSEIQVLVDDVYSLRDRFEAVKTDSNMAFDREAEFAIQIVSGNDYLMKIARTARDSLLIAVGNVAAIGLSLNPAKKQAYLVPRKNKVVLDISYMGLMDLATATGSIRWAQCVLVREGDKFDLQGLDRQPVHTYSPFQKDRDQVPIIGAYTCVKTSDGDYLTHPMMIEEIFAVRDRSEAWKAYVKDNTKKNPWVTDEGEMIKKTVVKQAYKYWPRSDRLEAAVLHMNNDDQLNIFGGEREEDPCPPELLKHAKDAAKKGVKEYEAFWKNAGKANRMLLRLHHETLKQDAVDADARRTVDNEPGDKPKGKPDANRSTDDFVGEIEEAERKARGE